MKKVLTKKKVCCSLEKDSIFSIKKKINMRNYLTGKERLLVALLAFILPKRRFNFWLWVLLCVPCLLASCDHNVHNDEEEGGLSVSFTWADVDQPRYGSEWM